MMACSANFMSINRLSQSQSRQSDLLGSKIQFAGKVTLEPGFQMETFDKAWERGAADYFKRLVKRVEKLPNHVELYLTHRFVEGKDAADSVKLDEVILGRMPRTEHEGATVVRLVRQVSNTQKTSDWWQSWKLFLAGNGADDFTDVVQRAITRLSKNQPMDVPSRFIGKPVIGPEFERLQSLGFMEDATYWYV